MKIMSWSGAVLGAAALLSAVSMATGTAARAAGPIVIGATTSESGPLSVNAEYQQRGIELAIAVANARGGWLGRRLVLKMYDDQSNPGTAVRLYTRLITSDKVDLLLGPYSSNITQAVAPLINKYGYATIDPGAGLPTIFSKPNRWNFEGITSSISRDCCRPPSAKARARSRWSP